MNKLPKIKIITLLILAFGINDNAVAGANSKAKPMSDPQIEVLQTCYAWDAVGVLGQGTGYCNVTTEPDVIAEYIGCSPQNSPRYFVSWYSPLTVLEYDVDFKRNGSAWNSFYNGTQVSSIYTDEQNATSYIRASARDINGFGNYDQAYLGPKSCFGGPQF